MGKIDIDPEVANDLGSGMRFGSGVELPFPVLYGSWRNGNEDLEDIKDSNPARYYGGWVFDVEPVKDLLDKEAIKLAKSFTPKPVTMTAPGGKKYQVYATRFMLLAPIAFRKSWYEGETKKRSPDYFVAPNGKNAHQHMQLLAYAGIQTGEREYKPWFPVVMTVTRMNVNHFQAALSEWERYTVKSRNQLSAGIPYNLFYAALGSFGKTIDQVVVGKGRDTSPITPPRVFLPDPLTSDLLEALYVGNEMATTMRELKQGAQEWLQAWGKPLTEGQINSNGPSNEPPPDFGNLSPDEEMPDF